MYIQITTKCNMRCAHCCFAATRQGEYLWGASWTRQYYPIEALDLFRLPGSGYTVWVPKMAHNENVDGGCHVDPSKWVWHGAYTGPQMGEGAGKDKEYKLQEEA